MRFILCIVLLSSYSVKNIVAKDCNDCMAIDSCPAALNLLKNNKNTETINLVRSSTCGYAHRIPKICCSDFTPSSPLSSTEKTVVTLAPSEKPTHGPVETEEYHPNLDLLPDECGDINGKRLIGSNIADLNEFPWMALVGYTHDINSDDINFYCAGSLINKRYVLTAAHCTRTINIVRLGEHDTQRRTDCQGEDELYTCQSYIKNIEIDSIIKHENYKKLGPGYTINDIALLRLSEPADFTQSNVAPICLPVTNKLQNVSLSGKSGVVAGWGVTENGGSSNVLRKVTVPIGFSEECVKNYQYYDDISAHNKICAGDKDRDSCKGDSGGPLFIRERDKGAPLMLEDAHKKGQRVILYGIVSNGPNDCGSTKYAGLYTDVTKYVTWILDHIAP